MGESDVLVRRTLVGSGWLREAPENMRAMMRRCMIFPARVVPGAPAVPISHRRASSPALPAPRPVPRPPVPPPPWPDRMALLPYAAGPAAAPVRAPQRGAEGGGAVLWWDDPITVGALLVVVPPMGLAALWSSRHFSREGRLALTLMMGLMMTLVTALAAVVVLR